MCLGTYSPFGYKFNFKVVTLMTNNIIFMQKLPLSTYNFERIRTENQLYVDKTQQMYKLMNYSHFVFLSRPRRFGKSLLLSTYSALFEGKKELFKGPVNDYVNTVLYYKFIFGDIEEERKFVEFQPSIVYFHNHHKEHFRFFKMDAVWYAEHWLDMH